MPFSLLRYPGGKFYALKNILPIIDAEEYEEYREPFLGGGTVFFNKTRSKTNWVNDAYPDLIHFLKFIKNSKNLDSLENLFKDEDTPSKERHKEIKELEPKTDLDKAFKFFYLNRTSFSGKMKNPAWGYRPIRSVHPKDWHHKIKDASKLLQKTRITSKDFSEVIRHKSKKKVLMYLDPPYFKANQKGHYVRSFSNYDHLRLKNELENTNHDFVLSYDDCDEIRNLYKNFKILNFDLTYRIENSVPNKNKRNKVSEILISNIGLKKKADHNKGHGELIFEKVRSPIRYAGSKLQALKFIKPLMLDINYSEYWEPFVGGGALFFAAPLAKKTVLNDSNKDLINFYQQIQTSESRNKLIKNVERFNPNKENFTILKNTIPKNQFEDACRYFIINRTAYSGIMKNPNWGYDNKKSLQPHKWGERIDIAGSKLHYAELLNQDFRNFFKRKQSEGVFAFIDPPYFHADQKRAYIDHFKFEDHVDLCSILRRAEFKFLLTYDDCSEIRKMYKWAKIKDKSWMYHTANSNMASRKKGRELFITNF